MRMLKTILLKNPHLISKFLGKAYVKAVDIRVVDNICGFSGRSKLVGNLHLRKNGPQYVFWEREDYRLGECGESVIWCWGKDKDAVKIYKPFQELFSHTVNLR